MRCFRNQIVFKVDVGAGVEVCHALLDSFAKYCDIVFCKRNVGAVKAQELGDPYCGAVQTLHDGKIALGFTGGPDDLNLLRRQGLFEFSLGFYRSSASTGFDGRIRFLTSHLKKTLRNNPRQKFGLTQEQFSEIFTTPIPINTIKMGFWKNEAP